MNVPSLIPDTIPLCCGSVITGPNPEGFLDSEGVVRQVAGTRSGPLGREEVRCVFFSSAFIGFYGLN